MTEKNKDAAGFEKSMDRLEVIVNEMEGGDLSLDSMIQRFEEGQKLIKLCTGKLNEVERKIEVLVKKGDDVIAVPFEKETQTTEEPASEIETSITEGELF